MIKIALLGATSHIAKGLISKFAKDKLYSLSLFARSPEKVTYFTSSLSLEKNVVEIKHLKDFSKGDYNVILNCVGFGKPENVKNAGYEIFRVTEEFDNLIINYILNKPETLYINFSSGAVYGTEFGSPVHKESVSTIKVNEINSSDFYRIAKINSEAKHRALSEYNIVDLRVFAYFSRYIDLDARYFMTDLVKAVKENKKFTTNAIDMTRDYISVNDLFSLIKQVTNHQRINDVFDVYSVKPVTKFEIIKYFVDHYRLEYTMEDKSNIVVATGNKNIYYSENKKANKIGYIPTSTSLDSIIEESKYIIGH